MNVLRIAIALLLLTTLTACASAPAQNKNHEEIGEPTPEETLPALETSPDAAHHDAILAAATKKYDALVADDLETFVQFIYPAVFNRAGGAQNYIEGYRRSMEQQELTIVGYSLGSISEVLGHGDELQSLLVVELDIQSPDESVKVPLQVIALSQDDGQSWTFIEVHTIELEHLYRSHPNLSPALEFSGMVMPLGDEMEIEAHE